jgi:hypothetical protein
MGIMKQIMIEEMEKARLEQEAREDRIYDALEDKNQEPTEEEIEQQSIEDAIEAAEDPDTQ